MYLQTYSMGWSFKNLYSITYTFTLFSEITKLDHFVEHHNIYTKEFSDVQIHLTSPLFLKQFFKEPFIVIKGLEYHLPSCYYQEQQRCPGPGGFKQGAGPLQKPLLLRNPWLLCPGPQCHQGLPSAWAAPPGVCDLAEPQTLPRAHQVWGWSVAPWSQCRNTSSTEHWGGSLPHPPAQMPQRGKSISSLL